MSPSAPTTVVCDSTAYLPTELREQRGIELVSLYVSIDGEQQKETEIGDYGAFFERLRASESGATTSQPSIGDFLAVYEPLLDAGREIASVHISTGISGTLEAAGQARRQLIDEGKGGERIEIFDSRSAAGGMGLCALGAAAAAAGGSDAKAVLARAQRTREELKMWFAIDTLEYLRRGGRIGGASAFIGSALKIKPILTFGTEISPVGRVRTRQRARQKMIGYLHELHDRGAGEWFVQHAQSPEDAATLVTEGTAIFGAEPLFCTQVGPVLGAHLGSGMLVGGTGCEPPS